MSASPDPVAPEEASTEVDWPADSHLAEALPADWPHRAHSRMVSAGGLDLHVQLMGQGPLLLCLHGTGSSTHTWRHVAPLLADRFALLALDLPGHGYSEAPDRGRFGMRAMTRVVVDLLERLGVCPEFLVGHSAGAALACRLALDGLPTLRGIVAINPALLAPRGLQGLVFTVAARGLVEAPFMAELVAGRARKRGAVERLLESIGSRIDEPGLQQYRRLFSNPRHVAAVLRMMSEWDLHRLEPELAALRPPLLLLSGARDGAVQPREILSLRRRLTDVCAIELDACGHLAHEEMPDRVAEAMVQWIDSLDAVGLQGTGPSLGPALPHEVPR